MRDHATIGFLPADWPAPAGVHAGVTTRAGGVGQGDFATFNLGDRAGDDHAAVAENRRRLRVGLNLPNEPCWLHQVHGDGVVPAVAGAATPVADAAVAKMAAQVCAVLTADCLPVLFCTDDGTRVAAAHAGWRGLAAGVLQASVAALEAAPGRVLAWLGPAIGPAAFEVGAEVRAAFVERDHDYGGAFRPVATSGKYLADIYALARVALAEAGVTRVYGGGRCTVAEGETFFSYRRQAGRCGRMASLVWRD